MDKKYNKKLIVVCGVILFALGAIIGWLIMKVFLTEHPDMIRQNLKLLYLSVAALVPALILSLSVKPIVYLGGIIINGIKNIFLKHSPMAIAGAFLGVVIGLMLAFLVYALLSQFLDIFALKLILTIFVALGGCIICAYACAKWLNNMNEVEEVAVESYNGYILDYSAFFSDKLAVLGAEWFNAPLLTLKVTLDRLISDLNSDNEKVKSALKTYDSLNKSGLLKVVDYDGNSEIETIVRYAQNKRLKIIANFDGQSDYGDEVKVLNLKSL